MAGGERSGRMTACPGVVIHALRSIPGGGPMIFQSPYPTIEIPRTPLTPFVLRQAGRFPDKPALIDGLSGRTLTYGQLAEDVRRAAVGLAQRGFQKGDILAIYAPNLPEYA